MRDNNPKTQSWPRKGVGEVVDNCRSEGRAEMGMRSRLRPLRRAGGAHRTRLRKFQSWLKKTRRASLSTSDAQQGECPQGEGTCHERGWVTQGEKQQERKQGVPDGR